MMEILKLKSNNAKNSSILLHEVLDEPYSICIRDATLKRFQNAFETFWRFLKEYLKNNKGIIVNSPKGCFGEIFALGFTSEEETEKLLEMTDSKNGIIYTYKEEVINKIYPKVKGYAELMDKVLGKVKA